MELSRISRSVLARRTLASVAFAVPALVGCRQIVEVSDYRVQPAASPAAPTGCGGKGIPAPPSGSTPSGDADFVVALRTSSWGDEPVDGGGPEGALVGLNLDGLCSTSNGNASCAEPSWATADHTDGPGGLDNAVQQWVSTFLPGEITNGDRNLEAQGERAYLVRVSGYNGTQNDGQVDVAFFSGTRIPPDYGPPVLPDWTQTETWNVVSVWLSGGLSIDSPVYEDTAAYVSGGVLVASFPSLLLGGPPVSLKQGPDHALSNAATMQQVRLVADVVPSSDGTWNLRGTTMAGRWALGELLTFASFVVSPDTTDLSSACNFPSSALQFIRRLCSFTDVRAELGGDSTELPCDALSFGIRFDAAPARLGEIVQGTLVPPCADLGPDTCELIANGEALDASAP